VLLIASLSSAQDGSLQQPAVAEPIVTETPAPAAESPASVPVGFSSPGPNPSRIAFGSCMHQNREQTIWKHVVSYNPDVFVFLGDNIYGDTEDMAVMREKYAKLSAKEGFSKLRQSNAKLLATWDDHDYGVNDGGSDYPKRKESQEVFREYWQPQAGYGGDEGIYSFHQLGDVQFIILDTRYFRAPIDMADGPDKVMLGEAQWAWLENIFATKPAKLRLIGSSIQFVSDQHRWEKWANFPTERDRFIALAKKHNVSGIIFMSGDRHLGDLSTRDYGLGYPIFDITSSGMSVSTLEGGWRPQEPNDYRVASHLYGDNFGVIEIDWSLPDPTIDMQLRDNDGRVVGSVRRKLSDFSTTALKDQEARKIPWG